MLKQQKTTTKLFKCKANIFNLNEVCYISYTQHLIHDKRQLSYINDFGFGLGAR